MKYQRKKPILVFCERCNAVFFIERSQVGKKKFCSIKCSALYRYRDVTGRIENNTERVGECFIWTGTRNPDGYGMIGHNNRYTSIHIFSWEQVFGPVPDDLELDHKCKQRACHRVAHLELVTRTENIRRSKRFRLFCPQGHRLEGENIRYSRNGKRRACLRCIELFPGLKGMKYQFSSAPVPEFGSTLSPAEVSGALSSPSSSSSSPIGSKYIAHPSSGDNEDCTLEHSPVVAE